MEYTVGLDLPVSIAVLYISIYHISHDERHLQMNILDDSPRTVATSVIHHGLVG